MIHLFFILISYSPQDTLTIPAKYSFIKIGDKVIKVNDLKDRPHILPDVTWHSQKELDTSYVKVVSYIKK